MNDDSNNIGYHEDPKNGNGIIRSRTTKQIRSWEMPRSIKSLEIMSNEFGKIEYPGLYILFDDKSTIYVGESKNLYNRLRTHCESPEEKIKKWNKVIVINDGRPATQSDFNDTVVRKKIELYLIDIFKTNKYNVVSQGEPQKLDARQQHIVSSLTDEINYFLMKKNVITKVCEEKHEEEIYGDALRKLLEKIGKKIQQWGTYEALIDEERVFIRPGSKKPKGWQITFRGRKPGSFIESLLEGKGYLLVSRGAIPFIPLSEIKKLIKDDKAFEQDTIDIWVRFIDYNRITLLYRKNELDVTTYRLYKIKET
ncbi:Excinuclease ABC, C subunit [Candidatus Magnetoovum chiemensis]|nr:Excinuclease ABC, C subunit [Candidatus Magnetoovum chiemensis]